MDFQKLSKYFFFAFLFLLPFQTVYLLREVMIGGEKWQYGTVGVYVSDLFLVSALAALIIHGFVSKKYQLPGLGYRVSVGPLILFILWAGASVFWSPDWILATYFFAKLLLAVGVFCLVRSFADQDVRIMIRILVVGAALQSLLGIGQFIAQTTFVSTLLGMSAHDAWQAGTSVLKNDTGRWFRAYGSFPHPNMLGGFLAAMLSMLLGYAVMHKEVLKKWLFLTGAVVILLGLILTFSRAAWLGVSVSVLALAGVVYRQGGAEARVSFFKTITVLVIAVLGFAFVLHETVFPRFDSTVIGKEGSVSERVQSLRDAQRVIDKGNMFLGTGIGNFTAEAMRLEPDRPVWTVQPAHNVFVLVFAELGLIGVTLFVALLGALLYQMEKRKNAIFSIALLSLLPSLLLDHFLWTSHFGLLFFFLLAGLASRKTLAA